MNINQKRFNNSILKDYSNFDSNKISNVGKMQVLKAERILIKIIKVIHMVNLTKHEKLSSILKIIVDFAGVNQNFYYILGSYALRNEREISDLDCNFSTHEWNKLRSAFPTPEDKIFPWRTEWYNNQWRWFIDLTDEYKIVDPLATDFSIEAFQVEPNMGFPNNTFSLNHLKKFNGLEKDNNGHFHFSFKTLLHWKKTMNRPKDQPDIERLEILLRNTKSPRKSPRKSAQKSPSKPFFGLF